MQLYVIIHIVIFIHEQFYMQINLFSLGYFILFFKNSMLNFDSKYSTESVIN